MKQTIDFTDFKQAFEKMVRKDQFSSKGLRALFEYLEDYEDSTGEEIEFDVIALCCDYTETTLAEVLADYPSIESLDELRDNTQVIIVDDSSDENPTIIITAF